MELDLHCRRDPRGHEEHAGLLELSWTCIPSCGPGVRRFRSRSLIDVAKVAASRGALATEAMWWYH